MSARLPDETIVVSRALQDHYRTVHGRETRYVPNGVAAPDGPRDAAVLDRLGLDDGGYVLFVGRLVPEKAVDLLIRGYRGVPGSTRLVVAGPSSFSDGYVDELRDLARSDPRSSCPAPSSARSSRPCTTMPAPSCCRRCSKVSRSRCSRPRRTVCRSW